MKTIDVKNDLKKKQNIQKSVAKKQKLMYQLKNESK